MPDIIDKLPNGIDTVVGTNGAYLSGGEQAKNSDCPRNFEKRLSCNSDEDRI